MRRDRREDLFPPGWADEIACPAVRILLALILLSARAWGQAPLSGFRDQGVFGLFVNEDRLGKVTFDWKTNGAFESSTMMIVAGQTASAHLSLVPDKDGRWTKAALSNPGDERVYERNGHDLKITMTDGGGKGTIPDELLVFEDYSPALISQALRAYDQKQAGRQTFPLLDFSDGIKKRRNFELGLERGETIERTVAGRPMRLTRWVYSLIDCDLHVLAGPDFRVYLVSGLPWFDLNGAPDRDWYFVREGYESLREPDDDPGVSQSRYEVRVQSVMMPMRDGVKLSTDI